MSKSTSVSVVCPSWEVWYMAKALVTIGERDLPTPSSYVGLTSTLVDSGRNTEGVMIGAVIREDVGKVELMWNYLTVGEWASILQQFSSTFGGGFTRDVTFFDQVRADWITREMYVGDRTSSGLIQLDPVTGAPKGWKNPKLSLIEV